MSDESDSKLAIMIKDAKESFRPAMLKDLHTQLAKDYKIRYDCYRKEGFTMIEALRLTVGYYD